MVLCSMYVHTTQYEKKLATLHETFSGVVVLLLASDIQIGRNNHQVSKPQTRRNNHRASKPHFGRNSHQASKLQIGRNSHQATKLKTGRRSSWPSRPEAGSRRPPQLRTGEHRLEYCRT